MSTLEILEAEMFWAQHDRPPPPTGEGEGSHAAWLRGVDALARDGLFLPGCGDPLPRLSPSVAPPRPGSALRFVRWSRRLLGFWRPARRLRPAGSAIAGRSTSR